MAFRAWNRGLAAMSPSDATPYGVWLFNGARWYPDPTFPGQSVCPGGQVLWAGKLDYWLVGGSTLCRFDGVNLDWEPLSIPAATLAEAAAENEPAPTIQTGACLAWNNCWFLGTEGVVLHWDGQSLTNVPQGLGQSKWLQSSYTAAVVRTDAAGNPFAFAVTDDGSFGGPPAPPQPGNVPAPQLFGSTGGPFSPLGFSPSAVLGGTGQATSPPNPTSPPPNLVAVDFDSAGDGWVAGNPSSGTGPAPLVSISTDGTARLPCNGTPPTSFTGAFGGVVGDSNLYDWSSVGVMPGGGAVAGGASGMTVNGLSPPQASEPVLVQVSCSATPAITRFRVPDPLPAPAPPTIPADDGGNITAVAVNAVNDAWAASSAGTVSVNNSSQPPHLYRLTDGQAIEAPAGNDDESRPIVTQTEPSIFEIAPPVVIPPQPTTTTVTQKQKSKKKTVKLSSPIYDIRSPKVKRTHQHNFTLELIFKVRRRVRIELEAVRGQKVVSSSGMKTFTGKRGELLLTLNAKDWPTKLKFVLPPARS